MNKLSVVAILAVAFLLTTHAHAQTRVSMPAAGYCLRLSANGSNITVTNTCNFIVQAKLRFSDGSNDYDTDFTVGYSYTTNRPGVTVKIFACSDGIVPSASSTEFIEPTYYTTQYYCVTKSNN